MNFYKSFLFVFLVLFISGCSKTISLESVETVRVEVVGNVTQFDFENVEYESINVNDILKDDDLKAKYSFIMIDDDYFETVSTLQYVERFEALQMPILFVDTIKGHLPFMRETTQKIFKKKIYSEYIETDKSTVMLRYPLPAIADGLFYWYDKDQETLSIQDFEYIVKFIYGEH
ncbi:hypothetical protein ACOQFO_11685 [Ureibacillus sp. MALMAid1270]|uniref:hypothetical protein n=1 Tax=Ureibacillus sp. MALMAid1270 TaxID=3411629 RepID=UPI003BA55C7A